MLTTPIPTPVRRAFEKRADRGDPLLACEQKTAIVPTGKFEKLLGFMRRSK